MFQDYLTPLHVAAHCGNVKMAKLLLDLNCEINARALVRISFCCYHLVFSEQMSHQRSVIFIVICLLAVRYCDTIMCAVCCARVVQYTNEV